MKLQIIQAIAIAFPIWANAADVGKPGKPDRSATIGHQQLVERGIYAFAADSA